MANKLHSTPSNETETSPPKRQKVNDRLIHRWSEFKEAVETFKSSVTSNHLIFTFVPGTLVDAVKNGDWILLDEINLAPPETLEAISGLLQDSPGLVLPDIGDIQKIIPDSEFRLFGCMNPANDSGKRSLPEGIRSKFTEIWVDALDANPQDLRILVKQYLFRFLPAGREGDELVEYVSQFYEAAKKACLECKVLDGARRPVTISVRTLCRALTFAGAVSTMYGLKRSIYEGLLMTFVTQADAEGRDFLTNLIESTVLKGTQSIRAFVKHVPPKPKDETRILFGSFWLKQGGDDIDSNFVLTQSVKVKLNDLARGVMAYKYPILIQGPTSAGKTSMIEYLAKRTGHTFVRVNNHEHTDLQEYIGSYVSDSSGKLVFREVMVYPLNPKEI